MWVFEENLCGMLLGKVSPVFFNEEKRREIFLLPGVHCRGSAPERSLCRVREVAFLIWPGVGPIICRRRCGQPALTAASAARLDMPCPPLHCREQQFARRSPHGPYTGSRWGTCAGHSFRQTKQPPTLFFVKKDCSFPVFAMKNSPRSIRIG